MPKLKLSFPTFRQAPSVVSGTGSLRSVLDVIDGPRSVMIMTSTADTVSAALDRVLCKAEGAGTDITRVSKPVGEPTWASLQAAAETIRSERPEVVIAVGGGSVLDWSRLAWARAAGHLVPEPEPSGRLQADPDAPGFWLIPTTCSTGAEAGDVAVYTTPAATKAAVISPDFLAERVVLDARFLVSLEAEPGVLESLVCDSVSHGLESCLSLVPNHLGKAYGLMALRTVLTNPIVARGRDDSSAEPGIDNDARDRLMEAGFFGGIAAANCSVGIVHAFAHSIGVEGVGHGLANAAALLTGIEFNAATPQMARLLRELGLEDAGRLIERLQPLVQRALRQPQGAHLRDLLGQPSVRRTIAERMARDVALRSNPRRANPEELHEFVERAARESTR